MVLHPTLKFHGRLAHLVDRAAFNTYLVPARKTRWFIYAKRPFSGPEAVLRYLSRYTHRVALSNSRITHYDPQARTVSFKWKDYRAKPAQRFKIMTLSSDEFMRRFLIHILPPRFHRIRYFGWFANHQRKQSVQRIRCLLTENEQRAGDKATSPPHPSEQPSREPTFVCRACGMPMLIIETLQRTHRPRGPPY